MISAPDPKDMAALDLCRKARDGEIALIARQTLATAYRVQITSFVEALVRIEGKAPVEDFLAMLSADVGLFTRSGR